MAHLILGGISIHSRAPTDLIAAAASGNVDRIGAIISNGGVDINLADYDGRTPLHLAASGGHLKVHLFIKLG